MEEIWKKVKDYPNYEVSNTGKIKSINYKNTGREKILTGTKDKYGYTQLVLSNKGKSKHFSLHRLVAISFIPNPTGLETVDHINGDKNNNSVSNLQWLSISDNVLKYCRERGYKISGCYSKNRYGGRKRGELLRIPIEQYSIDDEYIESFISIMDAERKTGIRSGGISACINKKKKTAGGYKWKRKEV